MACKKESFTDSLEEPDTQRIPDTSRTQVPHQNVAGDSAIPPPSVSVPPQNCTQPTNQTGVSQIGFDSPSITQHENADDGTACPPQMHQNCTLPSSQHCGSVSSASPTESRENSMSLTHLNGEAVSQPLLATSPTQSANSALESKPCADSPQNAATVPHKNHTPPPSSERTTDMTNADDGTACPPQMHQNCTLPSSQHCGSVSSASPTVSRAQSYPVYNMTGNYINSVNLHEEETKKELVTCVPKIPNAEADEMTEAENLRKEAFTHEPSEVTVTVEEKATEEEGSITESSTAGSSISNDERESEHDVSKDKRKGETPREAQKIIRRSYVVMPSSTRTRPGCVSSATDNESECEANLEASVKVSKKKTSSSASKKGTSRKEKSGVSKESRKTEKAKVPIKKATGSYNKINEAVMLVEPCIEEVKIDKQSCLVLPSSNVLKLLKKKSCTICLPSRIYCTSHKTNSDRHRRPIASLTSSDQVNDEPSTDRGSAAKKHNVSNIDAKDITSSLHALEYPKVIQLLEHIMPDDPSDETYIPLYFVVGVAYFKMSNYDEAKTHFKKCEAAALIVPDRHGDVLLCNAYLGDIEYILRNYDVAARHYKTGIEHYGGESVASIFKLTPPTLSAIHAKRASSFRNASRMVQAVHEYKSAIEKAQVDRDRLSAHTSLGNLYQSMGDNSNALAEYKQSIELAEKLSDYVSLGWAHGNIGNAYLGLNRKDEAVHHLQKSLDLAIEYEQTPQAIGRTYNNLGTAYQSMNDLDKAEEYYDLALSQAVYGNDIAGQARVYGNIGNVHMLRKNYERAIPHYSEVLRLSSDPATISTARHNRGCAYYEWATSYCNSSSSTSVSAVDYNIHGPDCDVDRCLSQIPSKAREYFLKGSQDLQEVVKHHEDRFQHIKGSPHGLTLSVSLYESNSRTFHRLQDCLINLHKIEQALLVAEQSRARTLGELMLKRKGGCIKQAMTSPLNFEDIKSIVEKQDSPLVYYSYTGARLIGWVFVPQKEKTSMNMFEVPLSDNQFEGKSFDYHLRYSLTEVLVERSFEMYQSIRYDRASSEPVQILFKLIAKPTLEILEKLNFETCLTAKPCQLIVISDSYTSLLPLSCLLDPQGDLFFGDQCGIQVMPSLLTMGILNQLPNVIEHASEAHDFCIIGDPSIPSFSLNGDQWALGRLPHAKREAEWVAHTLKTTPILRDHAHKEALLLRLQTAKLVHIATHGSAASGFLAFATVNVTFRPDSRSCAKASTVLLYPEEVEKLHISPALVVLSSCDSGRGTVKADGIQGMARAFILAGAQSVLTTLWKVPDESASVFMQFFYQYLMDGLRSTLALQKSILSVRCFAKYSQYIHWSGYQLTGQNICYVTTSSTSEDILKDSLGNTSVFPRLELLKNLEKYLVKTSLLPTDVQVIRGCPGVNPSEVVIDFIFSNYKKFTGGIFWLSCSGQFPEASIKLIEKMLRKVIVQISLNESHQALFVLDNMNGNQLPESLMNILKSKYVHIIVISTHYEHPAALVKEVDRKLVRGCSIHDVNPLSNIHLTQRIVYSVMTNHNFIPNNDDQQVFESLAEFTCGSPVISDITVKFLLCQLSQSKTFHDVLSHCASQLSLNTTAKSKFSYRSNIPSLASSTTIMNEITSEHDTPTRIQNVQETPNSEYDSWDSINLLIKECKLSSEENLLLNCLSLFGCSPVPSFFITEMSSLITTSSQRQHLCGMLAKKLFELNLLKQYPLPVVYHPDLSSQPCCSLVYAPQYISQCIWKSLDDEDKIFTFVVAHSAIQRLLMTVTSGSVEAFMLFGVCASILDMTENEYELLKQNPYQEIHSLYYSCKSKLT